MFTYLFRTGLFSAVLGGLSLLRNLKDMPFTWRTALAWVSWAITLALAVGAVVDLRRASRGESLPEDSPVTEKEVERVSKRQRR